MTALFIAVGIATAAAGSRQVETSRRLGATSERIALLVEARLPAGLALVEIATPPSLVATEESEIVLEWSGSFEPGRANVLVVVDGRKGWVRIKLAEKQRVLVAARALEAGETLSANDVTVETRPVAGDTLTILPAGIQGARVRRDLAPGAALSASDVELPAPLPRGTKVRIEARRGGAMVSAPGVLERAARPGERCTARLASRGVLVHGTLDGQGVIHAGEAP